MLNKSGLNGYIVALVVAFFELIHNSLNAQTYVGPGTIIDPADPKMKRMIKDPAVKEYPKIVTMAAGGAAGNPNAAGSATDTLI